MSTRPTKEQLDTLRAQFEKRTNSVGAERLTACGMYVNHHLEVLWRRYRNHRLSRIGIKWVDIVPEKVTEDYEQTST